MNLKGQGLDKIIQVELDKYKVELGVLEDKPKVVEAEKGNYKTYAGLKLLKETKKYNGRLVDVAVELDKKYKWLRYPFLVKNNQDVVKVVNDIVRCINGKADKQRVLNGMQAIVRNPILRNQHGMNTLARERQKGFNKLLMATGQFFKAIKAGFKNV